MWINGQLDACSESERVPAQPLWAISVRQPWAALLAGGAKTVEIRSWPTARRGPVLIHAAKVPDSRREGWGRIVTPELKALAALRGGIIGRATLVECDRYDTATSFSAAAERHLNAPSWFRPGGLYGFVFQDARPIAYHACPGRTLFFTVEGITLS
ncbi:MAG: ASCH domain-containing protein [Gemmata sp.]|jgi:hypothetical protein